MWIIEGFGNSRRYSDAWYSTDGVHWTSATISAPWYPDGRAAVAFNGRIWLLGYDIWSSPNGVNWTLVAPSVPAWEARAGHSTVSFGGRLWLVGGVKDEFLQLGEVWYSWDGANWARGMDVAGWERGNQASLVFNNKMWLLGGGLRDSPLSYRNDVLYSSDGVRWTTATAHAPWSPRCFLGTVVHANRMWVLGGADAGGNKNDVWWSSDGVHWTCAVTSAPWPTRRNPATLSFNGKIWILGGYVRNDVWFSPDGVNWTQSTSPLPFPETWSKRADFGAVVCDGRMWVMGGVTFLPMRPYTSYCNDVWYSSDGASWRQATSRAAWPGRSLFSAVVHNRRIFILGGHYADYYGGQSLDDVWYSSMPAAGRSWEKYR